MFVEVGGGDDNNNNIKLEQSVITVFCSVL